VLLKLQNARCNNKNIKYQYCVLQLLLSGMQSASFSRYITSSRVACLAVPYFFPHYVMIGKPKHFSFQDEFSEILPQMYIGLHLKYPSFLSDFKETGIFVTELGKIIQYQI